MPSPTAIRRGTVLRYKDDLWAVINHVRSSSGRGGGFVRTRMKSLSSGKVIEENFKSGETLEFADVMNKKMQYIFSEGHSFTFMDAVTYEQIMIGADVVGDAAKYLKEGLDVTVVVYGDQAIAIDIPIKVDYVVSQTEPATKGDTVSGNVLKDAVLDNGLLVRVPIFVKPGDMIRVNTEDGEYLERVTA